MNRTKAEEIFNLIQQQPGRVWTLKSVAREMDVSVSTVRRWLAMEEVSIKDLVRNVRQGYAEKKLLHSSISVKMLAAQLGFSDPSNFSNRFKSWTGHSPGEYRRKHSRQVA